MHCRFQPRPNMRQVTAQSEVFVQRRMRTNESGNGVDISVMRLVIVMQRFAKVSDQTTQHLRRQNQVTQAAFVTSTLQPEGRFVNRIIMTRLSHNSNSRRRQRRPARHASSPGPSKTAEAEEANPEKGPTMEVSKGMISVSLSRVVLPPTPSFLSNRSRGTRNTSDEGEVSSTHGKVGLAEGKALQIIQPAVRAVPNFLAASSAKQRAKSKRIRLGNMSP
jgi:hypothetical protein